MLESLIEPARMSCRQLRTNADGLAIWHEGTAICSRGIVKRSDPIVRLRVDDVGFTLLGVVYKVQGPFTKLKLGSGDSVRNDGSGSSADPCREWGTGPDKTHLKQNFGC